MTALVWYFDFISPFAYLQWQRMRELPDGVEVECRPVLLAGLLGHWNTRGPAEIPQKRVFTYRFAQWLAERAGVTLRMPPAHPFNPLPALRLAVALDSSPEAIGRIFEYIWRDGESLSDAGAWSALGRALGVDDIEVVTGDGEVKARLRHNTEAAIARGVFGVPTFDAEGLLFWGVDATEMLLDHLADPRRFVRGEYDRVARLPVGAARRV